MTHQTTLTARVQLGSPSIRSRWYFVPPVIPPKYFPCPPSQILSYPLPNLFPLLPLRHPPPLPHPPHLGLCVLQFGRLVTVTPAPGTATSGALGLFPCSGWTTMITANCCPSTFSLIVSQVHWDTSGNNHALTQASQGWAKGFLEKGGTIQPIMLFCLNLIIGP